MLSLSMKHTSFDDENPVPFKQQWIWQQKDVPALVATPAAIARDGSLIALAYRELNTDDKHMYAKIGFWNWFG